MNRLLLWRAPELVKEPVAVELTPRQADVLTGLHHGLTNVQIGNRLGMSEETVKTHAKRLFRALGARDRCHAVSLTASGRLTVHVKEQS